MKCHWILIMVSAIGFDSAIQLHSLYKIQSLPGLKIIYSTESSLFATMNQHHNLNK